MGALFFVLFLDKIQTIVERFEASDKKMIENDFSLMVKVLLTVSLSILYNIVYSCFDISDRN